MRVDAGLNIKQQSELNVQPAIQRACAAWVMGQWRAYAAKAGLVLGNVLIKPATNLVHWPGRQSKSAQIILGSDTETKPRE